MWFLKSIMCWISKRILYLSNGSCITVQSFTSRTMPFYDWNQLFCSRPHFIAIHTLWHKKAGAFEMLHIWNERQWHLISDLMKQNRILAERRQYWCLIHLSQKIVLVVKFSAMNWTILRKPTCMKQQKMLFVGTCEMEQSSVSHYLLFKDYTWWKCGYFGFTFLDRVLCIEFTNTRLWCSVFEFLAFDNEE